MKPLVIFLLMVTYCPTPHLAAQASQKTICLGEAKATRKALVVGDGESPIVLEVSPRVSHRIVTEIFRIVVVEWLGYNNVVIAVKDGDINSPNRTLARLSACADPGLNCKPLGFGEVPESMVNLEVWLGPGFGLERWTSKTEVEDCGPLGPIGRAGWYVPEWLITEKANLIVDHWRSFRNPDVASLFSLRQDPHLARNTWNNQEHYCKLSDGCVKGIYRPPQCGSSYSTGGNSPCATLLADIPGSNLEFLKADILRYNLLVEVAWVGPNLENYVMNRTRAKQPVVFFNWKPNTLTHRERFVVVAFPHCEDSGVAVANKFKFARNCEFEINQMQKMVWRKIKTHTPEIHHFLRNFIIPQEGYEALLKNYQSSVDNDEPIMQGDVISQIACKWLTNNEEKWQPWLPPEAKAKPKLIIGGIFPLSGTMWTQSGIAVASKMAIDAVGRNTSVLNDYSLELRVKDGKCQADVVMKVFIDYMSNMSTQKEQLVGILGPACSETVEPIAGVAKHFNSIIISYSAEGSLFNNREKYPYFYRTIPENNIFLNVYLDIFEHFGWKQVAALTEDGQKYPEYIFRLEREMQSQGKVFINVRISRDQKNNMMPYLADLRNRNARIIIGDFYDHAARAVMCEAYRQNMTATNGYLWFLPLWFASDWYDTDHYNKALQPEEQVSCKTSEMRHAIQGHISLAYKFYANKDETMITGHKVGDWMKDYRDASKLQNDSNQDLNQDNSTFWEEDDYEENKEFSKYGGYAYDAVWVYALALDKLLKNNISNYNNLHLERVTKEYMKILNDTDFPGVSGRVHFEGSSRPSQIILWQRVDNKTKKVGTYTPQNAVKKLDLSNDIIWFTQNKRAPHDGTEQKGSSSCIFEGLSKALNVSCEIAIAVVNLMILSLLIILVVVIFVAFKKKYEAKFRKTEARFRELGLLASSGMLALDEWEMARDHIVINRKLGEGAFGTVYGGEAFIEDRGWQAVAVKTLKVGANIEEKLDFLSEAEMMKRFDHTNVVRLIGVCTKGEPVYTIMEFMLYGDLKTYLLARRQLVKEPNRHTSEEVSDRQLTRMALDIARGLSYLAELKYVHRDLACRNCLVNTNRTVKIADFGMCRLMYDRDYYRFNKRGMLPVRWMAPESLTDGFFTPMSDVWSYGVLLYEMITFGSFPYQGLSNNQVIQYVQNFNTLIVPKGCKQELESLLLRCWDREVAQRPSACEIVEILAHHPELISPCLDMPLASVQVEDTDSIELTIHERSRVQSVSSTQGHVTPSGPPLVPQQWRNRTPVELNSSLNGCADVSNGGLVHSESSPMALHTRLLPAKGQYVTLHCRGTQDHSSMTSPKESVGIASL